VTDVGVAVVGAGAVGAATALELARRGASVALLEAEPEPGLAASGTNSGILHTGFDSTPGELETRLILRAARLREPLLEALGLPVLRCGALLRPLRDGDEEAIARLAANARRNGVEASVGDDGSLAVPGEAVSDPVAFTLGLVAAAERHGAELLTGFRVGSIARAGGRLALASEGGERLSCRAAVNCAGLQADEVARLAGDSSFEVYPRKGEFLVFAPDPPLRRIMLPVPSGRTKGVLVFPTVDGMAIAGPTAVDQRDKRHWSVRPEAREEILPKATAIWPPLEGAPQVGEYAGLRPAGRGVNYLVGASAACPELVNVAAIRSTGLTASLGIAEHVATLIAGVALGEPAPLEPGSPEPPAGPWWRRSADRRAAAKGGR
jgi:glycerol-3-phosphate dehydrogenase